MPVRIEGDIDIGGNILITSELPPPPAAGFVFTGSNWLTVTDNTSDWNLGSNWTVEFRMNLPYYPGGDAGYNTNQVWYLLSQPLGQGFAASGVDLSFHDLVTEQGGKFWTRTGNTQLPLNSANPSVNTWVWVAVVSSASAGTTRIYLDGQRQNVSPPLTPIQDIDFHLSSDNLTIGRRVTPNQFGEHFPFYGTIDNLRISAESLYTSSSYTPADNLDVQSSTRLLLQGTNFTTDQSGRHTVVTNS